MSEVPAEITIYVSQITEVICTYSWKALYAETEEEFDTIIQEFQDECYERQYDEVLEFYQDELEEYRASME